MGAYKPLRKEDSLSELFSQFADLNSVSKNLLKADKNSFVIWFDKCIRIDKRGTFFFLRKNKNLITEDNIRYANNFYKERI